jgi:hypothetical protein
MVSACAICLELRTCSGRVPLSSATWFHQCQKRSCRLPFSEPGLFCPSSEHKLHGFVFRCSGWHAQSSGSISWEIYTSLSSPVIFRYVSARCLSLWQNIGPQVKQDRIAREGSAVSIKLISGPQAQWGAFCDRQLQGLQLVQQREDSVHLGSSVPSSIHIVEEPHH